MPNYPDWLIHPPHFPFPFLPLPSLAAAFVAAALCAALMCWGMYLVPNHWPFSIVEEPAFPGGSPVWGGLAALETLATGVGVWKLGHAGDLAVACAWSLAALLVFLARARAGAAEEPLLPTHSRESYHIKAARPGEAYPLSESDLLRLLHIARYGDIATRNSIHVRIRQAMVHDPSERDVDAELCALDHLYLQWAQSGKRPTPALAQEFSRLLRREMEEHVETSASRGG